MTVSTYIIRDIIVLIREVGEQVRLMPPDKPGLNLTYVLGRLKSAEDSLRSASRELDYVEQTAPFRKVLEAERQARKESTL